MSLRRAAAAAALVLTTAACGADTATTDGTNATTPTTTERATPGGLAAVALHHLDAHETAVLSGGLTDLEDQRYVAVSLVLDGGDNLLSVRASDPSYLPGDRGTDECEPGAASDERGRNGARHRCRVLEDGTLVDAYLLPASRHTDGRSVAIAYAEGPGRSVQVHFDSAAARPELTWEELDALASDPLLAWETSAAANAEGERFDVATEDRVDR